MAELVVDPSVASIVGVVVGGIVTVAMALIAYKTVELNKKADEQKTVSAETLQKTAVILGHVNSEKTKAEGEIAALRREVNILRETLSEKRETAALLAQGKATVEKKSNK